MKKLLTISLCLLLMATPFKHMANTLADKGLPARPATNKLIAKLQNTYVTTAQISPSIISYHGHLIRFKEVWVEKRNKQKYFLIWFPYRKPIGGYMVCFTIDNKNWLDIWKDSERPPFWVRDNEVHSFGESLGKNEVFYEDIETLPDKISISLISSWHEEREKNITISINTPHSHSPQQN